MVLCHLRKMLPTVQQVYEYSNFLQLVPLNPAKSSPAMQNLGIQINTTPASLDTSSLPSIYHFTNSRSSTQESHFV